MRFAWQTGYAVLSVGPEGLNTVKNYIARQEDHHGKVSFQDELCGLLRDHEAEWNEKYLRDWSWERRNRVAVENSYVTYLG